MRRVQNARANRQRVAFAAHAVPCGNRRIAGYLRDVSKEADPQWGDSLVSCRALGDERERFGWRDSLSLCFECTHCQRRYRLFGDTYHGNVWWEQTVR